MSIVALVIAPTIAKLHGGSSDSHNGFNQTKAKTTIVHEVAANK